MRTWGATYAVPLGIGQLVRDLISRTKKEPHGFAARNRSSGIRADAPALTESCVNKGSYAGEQLCLPASAICFRILSALATLTTGPKLTSGDVGSPNLYCYRRI